MAIGKVNFEIVAPSHTALVIKNFELDLSGTGNMPTSLDPRNTSASLPRILDGEWLKFNAAHTKLTRCDLAASTASEEGQGAKYPTWSPVGDYSVQASSTMPIIWIGTFEAWTQVYQYNNTTSPLTNFAVGDRLVVSEGQPDVNSSVYHSVLERKASSSYVAQVDASGMVVARVIGKDNTRGLHIYAQAGGFGVWF